MKTYEAFARREGENQWVIDIPELKSAGQPTTFSGILTTATEMISLVTGLEPGKFGLRLVI